VPRVICVWSRESIEAFESLSMHKPQAKIYILPISLPNSPNFLEYVYQAMWTRGNISRSRKYPYTFCQGRATGYFEGVEGGGGIF